MKKVTRRKTEPPTNDAKTDNARDNEFKKVDTMTAALLSTSALVSGWLSFQGASAIFGDGMTALGFTVVVQGVVSMALWRFAVERGLQRVLLAAAWAVAVTFSSGTAYVNVDAQNNTASSVAAADTQVASFEAAIQTRVQRAAATAADKRQEAAIEAQDGGCGPICRGLLQEAETLQAEADRLHDLSAPLLSASSAARAEADTLPELLKVFQQLKTGAGELAVGLEEPEFVENTEPSSFDRVAAAYGRIFSEEGTADVATMGALWVACLMELLALACAMIRLSSRMLPSNTPLETRCERALAWVYDLRSLPKRIGMLASRRSEDWMKAFKPRTSKRSSVSRQAVGAIKSDQEYWTEGLHLQSQTADITMIDLITQLVREQAMITVEAKIEHKVFAKSPGITNVLINTGVLSNAKNGLVAGEKWPEWNTFLLEEFRRLRQQKPTSTGTRLRPVA